MIILIILTIALDFLISYLVPAYYNNLNLFYPMLTLTLIVFLYPKVDSSKYLKIAFLIGFLYDIIFSYIFMFHSLIFLLFAKIVKKIDKYIKCNFIIRLLLVIFFIFLYDFILYFLVLLTNYNNVTFASLIYKFKSSLILNIGFFVLLTIILEKKDFKKKEKKYQGKRIRKLT